MTPYYQDEWLTVYGGDCREVMRSIEPESVHCVVTSPPYWGLRDYGTASWEGGDEGCDHKAPPSGGRGSSAMNSGESHERWIAKLDGTLNYRETCGKCGARRQDNQLGLEATPEEYVANMVAVFREVRRVLRTDGTVWLNLGDTYTAAPVGSFNGGGFKDKSAAAGTRDLSGVETSGRLDKTKATGLKPKDLVGIPWRVAFALQADGWYLRSDIIWAKPNPMPESVTDRPTKSHEYLFLLSKSPRYYYDADAVREAHTWGDYDEVPGGQKHRVVVAPNDQRPLRNDGLGVRVGSPAGRNLRSVWTIATQPYPGAHFATFPRKLVEPCVKAGTSERGVCPECGAPWVRVVAERGLGPKFSPLAIAESGALPDGPGTHRNMGGRYQKWLDANPPQTTGWHPLCAHAADPVPAVCLDPFAGSGTTGVVAQHLGRRAVLIDLNPDYLTQAMARNRDIPLGLVG